VWGFGQGQPASGSGGASVGGSGGEGVGGNGLGGNGLGGSCGIETLLFGERSGTGIVSGVTGDSFVREDLPTDAYGAEGDLWLFDDDAAARVGLLRFDLSSVPPEALIQSAELRLFTCSDATCAMAFAHVKLFRILESWDAATVTWNDRETNVPWSTAGAGAPSSADATAVHDHYVGAAEASSEVVIPFEAAGVALIQDWVLDPAANFGVTLVIGDDDGGLQSSESSSAAGRPLLAVESWYCP
jgi:hypothetical protein